MSKERKRWLVADRVKRMFGKSARTWLESPCEALGGKCPADVLWQDPEKVDAVLTQLENGVVE